MIKRFAGFRHGIARTTLTVGLLALILAAGAGYTGSTTVVQASVIPGSASLGRDATVGNGLDLTYAFTDPNLTSAVSWIGVSLTAGASVTQLPAGCQIFNPDLATNPNKGFWCHMGPAGVIGPIVTRARLADNPVGSFRNSGTVFAANGTPIGCGNPFCGPGTVFGYVDFYGPDARMPPPPPSNGPQVVLVGNAQLPPTACASRIAFGTQNVTCNVPEGRSTWVFYSATDANCPGGTDDVTFQWGDGTPAVTLHDDCAGSAVTLTHLYGKDEGDPAALTITQSDTNFSATQSITLQFNEGDRLTSDAIAPIAIEAGRRLADIKVAHFTNVSYPEHLDADFEATIDWGDGTQSTGTIRPDNADIGPFAVTGSHTFAEPARDNGSAFPITVTIVDGPPNTTIGTATTQTKALEIVDLLTGRLVHIEATQDTVIGEQHQLQVRMSDGSPVSHPAWSGLTDAVNDYEVTNTSGIVVPLSNELRLPTVLFYFWKAHEYTVRVTTDQGSTQATFTARGPTVTTAAITTCIDDVNTGRRVSPVSHTPLDGPSFGMGLNDTCHDSAGMSGTFAAQGPGQTGGQIGVVQLIRNILIHGGQTCNVQAELAADISSFAAGPPVSTGTTLTVSDSPFTRLPSDILNIAMARGLWTRGFTAVDYLMYKSDRAGSIWVPIGTFSWNFNIVVLFGPALSRGTIWSLTRIKQSPLSRPSFTATVGRLPTWSGVANTHNAC